MGRASTAWVALSALLCIALLLHTVGGTRLAPEEANLAVPRELRQQSDNQVEDADAEGDATEAFELELGRHHHHDGHDRDRRCRIDECGFVKRCKDIYVGRICWDIYCYCESEEAEISVDDNDDDAPDGTVPGEDPDEGFIEKDRRCGPDDCGWIRWCKHSYCWNVYCHCRHGDAVEEEEEGLEQVAVAAALKRDDRCGADDCGWVEQCVDTPAGPKCWDIFCYCPKDTQNVRANVDVDRQRDDRCLAEDCGWVQDCVDTPAGPKCWDIFCYCHEDADAAMDAEMRSADDTPQLATAAAKDRDDRCQPEDCGWVQQCVDTPAGPRCWDIFCYCPDGEQPSPVGQRHDLQPMGVKCHKHDCGPVEHCVVKSSGIQVCWTINCTRGCKDGMLAPLVELA